ncbi:MAG: rhodanese-like domain-containing protein [Burkholderiaceae bacterium]
MNFVVENWMLVLVALSSGAMLFMPVLRGAADGGVTANAVVQMINREKAVLIDVCETDEYAAGHAVGARNIPLGQLEAKLPGAVKNKALPVILVCKSGARSARAVALAKKLGYDKAQSLSGGMAAWKSANLPVEKA